MDRSALDICSVACAVNVHTYRGFEAPSVFQAISQMRDYTLPKLSIANGAFFMSSSVSDVYRGAMDPLLRRRRPSALSAAPFFSADEVLKAPHRQPIQSTSASSHKANNLKILRAFGAMIYNTLMVTSSTVCQKFYHRISLFYPNE